MIPVFHFIAFSGTGKTTYLEKLITELKRRGLRVAAVKHDAHEFEIDREGKDSKRFADAGADMVAICSSTKCAVMEYRPADFSVILEQIHDVDLILAEGWHAEGGNRILLYRKNSGTGMKLPPADCIAVVSDTEVDTAGKPRFPLDDVSPMADFLVKQIS